MGIFYRVYVYVGCRLTQTGFQSCGKEKRKIGIKRSKAIGNEGNALRLWGWRTGIEVSLLLSFSVIIQHTLFNVTSQMIKGISMLHLQSKIDLDRIFSKDITLTA